MIKQRCIILLVFLSTTLQAQFVSSQLLQQKWKAFWIQVPDASPTSYGVYHFKKIIDLDGRPTSFVVHVSGDNRYKLFVNGQLVSLGPARGDLFHWNFETVDIAPALHEGKNVIAAVVWNFGDQKAEAQISFRTAFILQGNTPREEIINTDKTWMCKRDESIEPLRPELLYTYYVAGPGEKIDFNKSDVRWREAVEMDSSWKNAQEIYNGVPKGVFDWSDGWMLAPRTLPSMKQQLLRLSLVRKAEGIDIPRAFPKTKTSLTIPAHHKILLWIDQGFLTNAYPVLQFSKGKNAMITLRYAEALYKIENTGDWRKENQKGNRNDIDGKRFVGVADQLISSGQDQQQFTPLAWRTYRYVELAVETNDEALTIDDLFGVATGYPFAWTSSFTSSSQELTKILEVGTRTAEACAMETYMDCPYYEQLQYIGDTRIQALITLYNSNDDRLVRQAIDQLDNSRIAEGITLSRFPTAHAQEIPTFSLLWIAMVHDYWMYRNNASYVKSKFTGIRSVLDFFMRYQGEDGSLHRLPYWPFTDWANGPGWESGIAPVGGDGSSSALDIQLCYAFQRAAALEHAEGIEAYATLYREKALQLQETVRKKYWDENKKLFADTFEKKTFSQHPNALAVLTNIVTGNDATQLAERMLSDKTLTPATIYFQYYVHEAVRAAGLGDRYLLLLGDWRDQLANGLTTWAEISDHNYSRSDSHAWGASPNIEMYRTVLGIDSGSPGFRDIVIEPHLGSLMNASGKIPHPQGVIDVAYKNAKGKWTILISIPQGTTGTFTWLGKRYPLDATKVNEFKLRVH